MAFENTDAVETDYRRSVGAGSSYSVKRSRRQQRFDEFCAGLTMRLSRDQPAPLERSAVLRAFRKLGSMSSHDFIRFHNREVKLCDN